jgi:hypothetical protein
MMGSKADIPMFKSGGIVSDDPLMHNIANIILTPLTVRCRAFGKW